MYFKQKYTQLQSRAVTFLWFVKIVQEHEVIRISAEFDHHADALQKAHPCMPHGPESGLDLLLFEPWPLGTVLQLHKPAPPMKVIGGRLKPKLKERG